MKKKILLQMDSDPLPSVFDAVTAYDAGVDALLQQGGVTPGDVRNQIYGLMFTRGGSNLKNSAAFIGGYDVAVGEAMLKAARDSFFGPVRVSLMLDSNGCNTTAAAAVAKICGSGGVKGKKVVVLAGTGPVGKRIAGLLAQEGAEVTLSSRSLEHSQIACKAVNERFGVQINAAEVANEAQTREILQGAYGVLASGAAGVQLIAEDIWTKNPDLKVLGDINAVPPLGVEGIDSRCDGEERDGKLLYGALGIGNLKMSVHRECVARLFTANDLVFDAEAVYAVAKEIYSA